jgi:hypothetical protein
MNMRMLPVLGITGLLSVALAGSAVAGGGWPPAPGTYKTTDLSATAYLVGATTTVCYPEKGCFPVPSESASVFVDRGLHTFKPKGGKTLVQQTGTMLNFSYSNISGANIYGCWMIADGDFKVAKGLSSASLVTTVQGESNCPGMPLTVSALNVVTPKGDGGGGGGTVGPITLNVSWTYKGAVSHSRNDGTLTCGSFRTAAKQDSDHASATSQGVITGASATLTADYGYIDNTTSNQVVKGVPVDACLF